MMYPERYVSGGRARSVVPVTYYRLYGEIYATLSPKSGVVRVGGRCGCLVCACACGCDSGGSPTFRLGITNLASELKSEQRAAGNLQSSSPNVLVLREVLERVRADYSTTPPDLIPHWPLPISMRSICNLVPTWSHS